MNDTPTGASRFTKKNYDSLILRIDKQDEILASNGNKLDKILDALLGNEFSTEKGLIEKIRKHEKRIKVLEVVYIGGVAVITVGGIVIEIINKLNITL
jgi:hypothetical protein